MLNDKVSQDFTYRTQELVCHFPEKQHYDRSADFLYKVINATSEPIFVLDRQHRWVLLNDAYCNLIGYPREYLLGKCGYDFLPQQQADLFWEKDEKVFATGIEDVFEASIADASGKTYAISIKKSLFNDTYGNQFLIGTICSQRPIFERKELELSLRELHHAQMQLVQTEKMSSLGQMLAGVAHEINNPVNFISANISPAYGYAQDLLRLLGLYRYHYPDPLPEIAAQIQTIDLDFLTQDLPKLLNSMEVGSLRVQEILASLRNFCRMDEAEKKNFDIHQGLDSTLIILSHRIKAKPDCPGIEIVKEYGNIPLVNCYAGQLNQVFMNILSNAIDALEESALTKKGEVTDKQQIRIRTFLNSENQVTILIADNGLGIQSDLKQRIFDPFFTTKPIGKGTGLGLAISHQVITQWHRGHLECFSQPGKGTEFAIAIPLEQK